MTWRLSNAQYENLKGDRNRDAFEALVKSGVEPGILAYDDGRPVGWCAVAPRETYPRLARSRILKPVDDMPVWSIVCLFVAKSHRAKGVSTQLIRSAAEFAAQRGAKVVEGYPVEPRKNPMPDVFAFTGLASAFRKVGFVEVARRSETRPVMRLMLSED